MSKPRYRPQSHLHAKAVGGSLEMTFQEPSLHSGQFDDGIPEREPMPRDILQLKRDKAADRRRMNKEQEKR